MLSIIVPIYNSDQYLYKCIESIINQKYKDLEIILIDDGSTDDSAKISDEFAKIDNRVKVFHKENGGLVQARKEGLRKATGEYVTFVDADDWIDSDMYFELMKIMINTEADFIDSGFFTEKNGILYEKRVLRDNIYKLDDYTKHIFFLSLLGLDNSINITPSIWSKIYKAELIKNVYEKVPNNMQNGEDVISVIYCILNANAMVQTGMLFYHYNYRDDSLSHIKEISMLRKELLLWNYCGEIILENDKFMYTYNLDCCIYHKLFNMFVSLTKNKFDSIQFYSFPNIEKLFDKKIVLYGAGRVGKDYLTQILKYERCNIVCWADKKYEELEYEYRKVVNIDYFLNLNYDVVVIAVEKEKLANEIKDFLMKKNVPEEKILWCTPIVVR